MSGSGTTGIGASGPNLLLTITHCTVQGFGNGIIVSGMAFTFLIADTVVTNNGFGISAGFSTGTLDHVVVSLNTNGVAIAHGTITVVDTIVSNNVRDGFAGTSGAFSLAHSTATNNGTGVDAAGGSATSFGDNHIRGNGTDVKGTLTNVGTQ